MGFGGGLESWEDTSALHSCGRQVHFQGKGLLANLISRPQFCSEPVTFQVLPRRRRPVLLGFRLSLPLRTSLLSAAS